MYLYIDIYIYITHILSDETYPASKKLWGNTQQRHIVCPDSLFLLVKHGTATYIYTTYYTSYNINKIQTHTK